MYKIGDTWTSSNLEALLDTYNKRPNKADKAYVRPSWSNTNPHQLWDDEVKFINDRITEVVRNLYGEDVEFDLVEPIHNNYDLRSKKENIKLLESSIHTMNPVTYDDANVWVWMDHTIGSHRKYAQFVADILHGVYHSKKNAAHLTDWLKGNTKLAKYMLFLNGLINTHDADPHYGDNGNHIIDWDLIQVTSDDLTVRYGKTHKARFRIDGYINYNLIQQQLSGVKVRIKNKIPALSYTRRRLDHDKTQWKEFLQRNNVLDREEMALNVTIKSKGNTRLRELELKTMWADYYRIQQGKSIMKIPTFQRYDESIGFETIIFTDIVE